MYMYILGWVLYFFLCAYTLVKIWRTKTFTNNRNSRLDRKKVKSLEYIGGMWFVLYILQIFILALTAFFSGTSAQEFFNNASLLFALSTSVQVISLVIQLLVSITVQSVKANKMPLLLLCMIVVIVGTNVFFGLIYQLLVRSNLTFIQSLYFSFAINYSLPLQDDLYNFTQKQINGNSLYMLVQIAHITISKIAELVLLGVVVSKISDRFGRSN